VGGSIRKQTKAPWSIASGLLAKQLSKIACIIKPEAEDNVVSWALETRAEDGNKTTKNVTIYAGECE
jgi:hypothetical protein